MANPMAIAQTLLGKGEVPDRAAIQDYLQTGGVNLDPVTTAWCAAYVNSTLKQAGYEGTGSNMARSFLNYGEKVDQPQKGDLAVFSRGDPNGPYGHVGFFDSQNPDGTIRVLGGNQGDAVSYGNYPSERLLGYRRPTASGAPPQSLSGIGSPTTPPAGSNSLMGGPGGDNLASPIPSWLADYANSEEGGRKKERKSFLEALGEMEPEPAARIAYSGGDARGSGNMLLDALNAPTAAEMLLKKRMQGIR